MEQTYHGGECCGVTHIWSFPAKADEARLKEAIKDALEFLYEEQEIYNPITFEYREGPGKVARGKKAGHIIEVALTDAQMVEWAPTLKKLGFRKPVRCLNDNSGNYINVTCLPTKKATTKAPYKW